MEDRKPTGEINNKATYICGLDVARTGADETAVVVLEEIVFSNKKYICYMETLDTPKLTSAIGRIAYLDKFFNFKKIIVDETGLGAGVSDVLKDELGAKVKGITFSTKSKAEMFNNLKIMLQNNSLYLPNHNTNKKHINKKLYYQLLSITQEWSKIGQLLLSHPERDHDDLACALALASYYFNVTTKRRREYALG